LITTAANNAASFRKALAKVLLQVLRSTNTFEGGVPSYVHSFDRLAKSPSKSFEISASIWKFSKQCSGLEDTQGSSTQNSEVK
jgi:hypothetical protein